MTTDWVLQSAQSFALEAEEILGVSGLASDVRANGEHLIEALDDQDRIDAGGAGSIAGAVIALFAWIDQIRRGRHMKGASREALAHDLVKRALEDQDLSGAAKERLVIRALDRFLPPSDVSSD